MWIVSEQDLGLEVLMMISTICWNPRSINTQGVLEILRKLKNFHNLSMIIILEPFSDNSQLYFYRVQLQMDQAYCNSNGKIWVLWTQDVTCRILDHDEQQITYEI